MARADKRAAMLAGATAVFARDGYTRASIDAIAATAQVSSRTIYNHFGDKAQLFQAVIQESAARVAAAQIALIERYLHKVTDLETDLFEFGVAWLTPIPDFADHSALLRQINAELEHIPQAAIDSWQETGPLRVRRALAERFARLGADGLLKIDDPERAALHFGVLIFPDGPPRRRTTRTEAEIVDSVRAGVRTFLHGHLF
ncbi:TetR/AcrR family transcriptional regulator [Kribbella sp. NBC_01245]|uniref:TetR/AcrR family transcriptional regulator n=1 Tax=Kribbella sp. NBC_01245 TaxID=2903578 RepID=UPI002E2DD9E6|nr:TetR/AcrR family transcriptional regulator [Kribbella sp. NBC_01245]